MIHFCSEGWLIFLNGRVVKKFMKGEILHVLVRGSLA